MKVHGRIDPDGKRREWVYIDPEGTYVLASRVTGKAVERMETLPEYRKERYEIDERGNLLEPPPEPSDEHKELRTERVAREKRQSKKARSAPSSKKPDATPT